MIWIIAACIPAFIIFGFARALKKDDRELRRQPLAEKFNTMVEMLNWIAYGGQGTVFYLSRREFNLYREGANEIIKFEYSTGHLTLTWKYKFVQEVIHSKQFNDVRTLSAEDQEKICTRFIEEMSVIKVRHQKGITKNTDA